MQFFVYDPNPQPDNAAPPTQEMMAQLGKFIADATHAGKLVATGALHPKGTRLRLADGKYSVTDGPFIELKELMGGWAVIRASSLDEAIEWCKKFRLIIGEGESEIVPIYGAE